MPRRKIDSSAPITDEQRIYQFENMMRKNVTDIRITNALLSAAVNSISLENGMYELGTPKSELAFKAGQEVYQNCLFNVSNTKDTDEKRRWLQLTKDSLLFLAHRYFDSFLLYLEFDRKPEKRFYAPRKKQLKPIVDGYQACADGECDLLTVSMPKRCGKSQLGSILYPIWRAGFFPDKSILLVGQGDQLVKSFYDGCLEILQDKATYNYWQVFPNATLTATNAELKTIDFNMKRRFSTITCRSIDGKLTGATEASNFLSIDDPVSGYEEAQNYDRLDLLWNKIRGDVLGRRKENVPVIAIGTRYSLKDPIGHLQEIGSQLGWRMKIIEVPALDPVKDTSNFDYKYGLGFSTAYYRNERKLTSESQWASEFQQQPIETRGAVFARDSLQYYTKLPDIEWDAVVAVLDPSEGKGDFTCMVVAYLSGTDVYIEDVVFSTALPEFTTPQCAQKCVKNNVGVLQVESNQNGLLFAEHVSDSIKRMGGRTSVRTKRTTANKQTKIIVASDNIKKHFWFKNPDTLEPNSDYAVYLRNLWGYSQLAKNQHDDAPDCTAMLENMVETLSGCKVVAFQRPF